MNILCLSLSVVLATNFLLVHIGTGLVIALILGMVYYAQYRKLKERYSRSNITTNLNEKNLLEQLFNNMPDRIYFKDRQSRFILANKFVSGIMGEKDPTKLIGKTDFDFYEKQLAQGYYDDEERIMKEGKPMINKEEPGLDTEGNRIYVSTTKIPVRDSHNRVIGVIGIGRDITNQKKAEQKLKEQSESLQEANTLLEERQEEIEQISEELRIQAENLVLANKELQELSLVASETENVVIIMDADGNFEWVNDGFRKKYGVDLESFIKRYGTNLRNSSSHSNISEILSEIIKTGEPRSYISCFTDNQEKEVWSQTNISPIFDADRQLTSLVLIDSDITELKLAEAQIRQKNKEITAQAEELQKLNATKNKLFSIIGHDLKNPLNAIIGFSDLLYNNTASLSEDQIKKYSEIIHDSSRSAYQLLENLLDWARIQRGKLKPAPVIINLNELVQDMIPLQQIASSDKNIELVNTVDTKLHLFADRNMINTVLRNLTSNAIKYTEEGGKVIISATANGEMTSLLVEDTGIGMTNEVVKNLFNRENTQTTPGTSGEKGTGLGLIISKEFVEKNNGTIEVKSKPGKGTTFIIHLPSKEPQETASD